MFYQIIKQVEVCISIDVSW